MPWNVKHNATCLVLSIHSLYFSFLTKKAESNQQPVLIISPFFLKLYIPTRAPFLEKCIFKLLKYLVQPLKQSTSSTSFLSFIALVLSLSLFLSSPSINFNFQYIIHTPVCTNPQFHLLNKVCFVGFLSFILHIILSLSVPFFIT